MELLAAIKLKVLDLQDGCQNQQEYDAYAKVLEYLEDVASQSYKWKYGEPVLPMKGLDGANIIMSDEEREIRQALLQHNGDKRKAAEQLGISERTIYRKMQQFNIKKV